MSTQEAPFVHEIDGKDVWFRSIKTTWFGGADDPQDSGETASGFSTKSHPETFGAALPMDIGAQFPATHGSGIPKMPYWIMVKALNRTTGKSIYAPLIDLGPNIQDHPENGLDLTKPAFKALGVDPSVGVQYVDYCILNGAKYFPVPSHATVTQPSTSDAESHDETSAPTP